MKKKGIVKEYNGQNGIIESDNKKYIVKSDDVITKNIKVNDKVEFYESNMYFGNDVFLVARKVEKESL